MLPRPLIALSTIFLAATLSSPVPGTTSAATLDPTPPAAQSTPSVGVTDCDRLAGLPDAVEKGVGVDIDKIDPTKAAAACNADLLAHPKEARLIYNLGRVDEAAKYYTAAIVPYRAAADLGNADAMVALGIRYANGFGVLESSTEAMRWYLKAANLGNASAMFHIATTYEEGLGVAKDPAEALRWYRKAADLNYSDAMLNIGMMYVNGTGVPPDPAEALRWFHKAADLGNPDATFDIGMAYQNGDGVSKDQTEANKWYRKAADLGFPDAMYTLGFNYAEGEGVAKDQVEALRLYHMAADLGHMLAMYAIAVAYDNGDGVAKDSAVSADWVVKAIRADRGQAFPAKLKDDWDDWSFETRIAFQEKLGKMQPYAARIDGKWSASMEGAIAKLRDK